MLADRFLQSICSDVVERAASKRYVNVKFSKFIRILTKGFLVSDRISSISSLERKKNLGKYNRFLSRYWLTPDVISSNIALADSISSSSPDTGAVFIRDGSCAAF